MRHNRSSQRGALSVELALCSLIFFAALMAVFDFGRVFFYQSRLKYAVSQSTRFATTGNVLESPETPGTNLSRADSIVLMIKQLSGFDDFTETDIDVVALGPGGTTIPGAGGPGDIVSVTATYRVGMIAPYLSAMFDEGSYEFSATTSFRNEEFPEATLRTLDFGSPTEAFA